MQHVSIFLDHLQGATLFLAKITFFKNTLTDWFSFINLVLWQHVILYKSYITESEPGALSVTYDLHKIESCWSNFKCLNVKNFIYVHCLVCWLNDSAKCTVQRWRIHTSVFSFDGKNRADTRHFWQSPTDFIFLTRDEFRTADTVGIQYFELPKCAIWSILSRCV